MAEPTLQEVFGAGATQSANGLTILKADLVSTGLTPVGSNKAEGLLVAILMKAALALTEAARLPDLPNRNVSCTYTGQDRVTQAGSPYQRDAFVVLAYKSSALVTLDPDDY